MRGHLKTIILKLLEQQPMSGSEMLCRIEQQYNWKPSYGSLYPQLEAIEKEGLATTTTDKSKKIYSLTEEGRQTAKKSEEKKEVFADRLERIHLLMEELYGIKSTASDEYIKEIKSGQLPLHEIFEESEEMKSELMRLYKEKKIKDNLPKIKDILADATIQLRNIR